jgi:hypothetical protein
MCGDRSLLTDLDTKAKKLGNVQVANHEMLKITGTGTAHLQFDNGTNICLKNVFLVPGPAHNLVSVGKLAESGISVTFSTTGCRILDIKGDQISLIPRNQEGLFATSTDLPRKARPITCLAQTKSENVKWHLRLGHLNHRDIIKLSKAKNSGVDNVTDQLPFCEGCFKGRAV